MNVHIEGHINWTNSTANFITTGTLSAGAGTLDSLTLDLTQDYLFCERGTVLCVQGQTAATASQFELYSNDGDGTDSVYLATFGVGTPAGVTNSESLYFGYDAVNSRTAIASLASGTGTVRPMHLYTGANTTQLVLNIDGSVSMAGALGVTGAVTGGSLTASDGTDQVGLSVSGNNAYMKWNDGELNLVTDEENTNGIVNIKGNGTGKGYARVYSENDQDYLSFFCSSRTALVSCAGDTPYALSLQAAADVPIFMFASAASGETQELKIYGFREGDSLRSLELSVGVDAADTASFDGLTNYRFDGNILANTGDLTFNASADSAAVADEVTIGGYEIGAGNRVLAIGSETTVAEDVDETKFSHKLQVRINGATYYIMLTAT